MNTALASSTIDRLSPANRVSAVRRFFGVVGQPQTYRNVAYLMLGLPLGVLWFTVLVTGLSAAVSLVVVALIGVPMLLGMWYVTRWFANLERVVANRLLGEHIAVAPIRSGARGNLWARLRSMSSDRGRWSELGYLVMRFPVGLATFTAAVTALAVPGMVAYAPVAARHNHDHPFGQWKFGSRLSDIASSAPWSWLLVPLGIGLLFAAFHLLNKMAKGCGRWTAAWLGAEQ